MPEGTIDLRSGQTVWRSKHGPPKDYPLLMEDASCEVVIIGGGITGALIMWELVEAGVDCLMIDQSAIGGGSTSASTALLLYELDTPMSELAGQIGDADAAGCYRACLGSIEKIEHIGRKLG
jgi:heterodisulfide reductase subunit A-like polyferredoxin